MGVNTCCNYINYDKVKISEKLINQNSNNRNNCNNDDNNTIKKVSQNSLSFITKAPQTAENSFLSINYNNIYDDYQKRSSINFNNITIKSNLDIRNKNTNIEPLSINITNNITNCSTKKIKKLGSFTLNTKSKKNLFDTPGHNFYEILPENKNTISTFLLNSNFENDNTNNNSNEDSFFGQSIRRNAESLKKNCANLSCIKMKNNNLNQSALITQNNEPSSVKTKTFCLSNNKFKSPLKRKKSESPKLGKKTIKQLKVIGDFLSVKKKKKIENILLNEGLIFKEMDSSSIGNIIKIIECIKAKSNYIFYKKGEDILKKKNFYYILLKGELEYGIDNEKYYLAKGNGLGVQALDKNSKKNCYLKTVTKCSVLRFDIEKYKVIMKEYLDKAYIIKYNIMSNCYLFKGLNKKLIELITNESQIIRIKDEDIRSYTKEKEKGKDKDKFNNIINDKVIIIKEKSLFDSIYFIAQGEVICTKLNMEILFLGENEIFGEIGLFNNIDSMYSYYAKNGTVLIKINYCELIDILGNEYMKILLFKMFENALNSNEELNKYIETKDIEKIFNLFQLKLYINSNINTVERKIFLPISGNIFKNEQLNILSNYTDNLNTFNFYQNLIDLPKENFLEKGTINIDSILVGKKDHFNFYNDMTLIFECNWHNIEKSLSNSNNDLHSKINLIKPLNLFNFLCPYKLFKLSLHLKIKKFKNCEIILSNGPISDNFYIIKNGIVNVNLSNNIIKKLKINQSFGDICANEGYYDKKLNFIADGEVECYYLEKEIYEKIVDDDKFPLKPLNCIIQMKDNSITLDNLYFIKDVGKGSYGNVYLVHNKKNFFAIKTADIHVMRQMKIKANLYINEKKILFSLDHPFIVSLINTFKTNQFLLFLFEYVDGITLNQYIKIQKRKLRSEEEIKFFGGVLISILNYLQLKKIIHRDLKPDNLMMENSGYLKCIDFGSAINLINKDYTNTFVGTYFYMAPEIINGKKYNFSVDYWSVGVILYEMFYGNLPFGNGKKEPMAIFKDINEKNLFFSNDRKCTECNKFISGLLDKNPKIRISNFNQVKNLKLFENYNFQNLLNKKIKPYYSFESKMKNFNFKSTDISFQNYIKVKHYFSESELDDEKNLTVEEDEFYDF